MTELDILAGRKYVLLDFDGPVCSVFAGYPAPAVAQELVHVAELAGLDAHPDWSAVDDPHEVLRRAHAISPSVARRIEAALQCAEITAVDSATPTPGAKSFLTACSRTGRAVAIVSNNCAPAIDTYVRSHDLGALIASVQGRDPTHADLMKPHPHLLHAALIALGAAASESFYVGDTVTDVVAASAAGMPCIGYANKPSKHERLTASGAALITADMEELARFLLAS